MPDTRLLLVTGPIQEPATHSKLINETIKKFGRLDVLFNNAGVSSDPTLEPNSLEQFQFVLDVNLKRWGKGGLGRRRNVYELQCRGAHTEGRATPAKDTWQHRQHQHGVGAPRQPALGPVQRRQGRHGALHTLRRATVRPVGDSHKRGLVSKVLKLTISRMCSYVHAFDTSLLSQTGTQQRSHSVEPSFPSQSEQQHALTQRLSFTVPALRTPAFTPARTSQRRQPASICA